MGNTIMNTPPTIEQVKHTFQSAALMEVVPNRPVSAPRRARRLILIGQSNDQTPMTQAILEAAGDLNTPARQALLASINLDDQKIAAILQDQTESDPDYIDKMRANLLGFFMEDYVACHMKCPVCGGQLCVFEDPRMPTVDLACHNREKHLADRTCYLYQVKITTVTEGSTYFSRDDHYISVGSRRYGNLVHSITPQTDPEDQWICPGYICLVIDNSRTDSYHIDVRASFILIPNYQCRSAEPFYYYRSDDPAVRPQISWNQECVELKSIRQILKTAITQEELTLGYNRILVD